MSSVKDYKIEITKVAQMDGDGYIAYIPELDCFGDGETVEQAISDVYAVAEDLIEIAMEDGKEIPVPQYFRDVDDFSGKLSIRLPKTLHKQVSERARAEDCSINQLISTYIAMGLGDAFGRIESLMTKQNQSAESAAFLLSYAKEMWDHTSKQKFDFYTDLYSMTYKGGQNSEAQF